jgi:hypothetical protein
MVVAVFIINCPASIPTRKTDCAHTSSGRTHIAKNHGLE